MIIYAISDIHGCLEALRTRMEDVDLDGDNRMVFLGDYIDYGRESCGVLEYIRDLQLQHGAEKVIALKGNHESMLLEWIDNFNRRYSPDLEALAYDSWLKTDSEHHFNTFRTLVSREELEEFEEYAGKASFTEMNRKAVRMVMEAKGELIRWIRAMPSFYETEKQIFVHAGVDEEAGEYWMWGTSDEVFLWKHPASFGNFVKTVVAGHIGTGGLAHDKSFHDVFYDGRSHYYIDGSVYKGGKLLLLAYDTEEDRYYQVENGRMIQVKRFNRYR